MSKRNLDSSAVLLPLGDLNQDGYEDLAVFAVDAGGVVFGGPDPMAWSIRAPFTEQAIGYLSSLGDVNGDGWGDFLVVTESGSQSLRLFAGGPADPYELGFFPRTPGGRATFVWRAGDIDGDGFDDLITGRGMGYPMSFFVFWGSRDPLASPMTDVSYEESPSGDFPSAVVRAGDVDGDGFDDLFLQGHWEDDPNNGWQRTSALQLLRGGPSASLEHRWTRTWIGAQRNILSGADFNGDGFSDHCFSTREVSGIIWVFLGDAQASNSSWVLELSVEQRDLSDLVDEDGPPDLGRQMVAGDLNGDGFDDLVASAPHWNRKGKRGGWDDGLIQAYLGGPEGLAQEPAWRALGEDTLHKLGTSLAVLDLNGDGLDDVVATEPGFKSQDPDRPEGEHRIALRIYLGRPDE